MDHAKSHTIGFNERYEEGRYWEMMTLKQIPALPLFRLTGRTHDCVTGIDAINVYADLSIRCRRQAQYFEKYKTNFTFRLTAENGHQSEFDKVIEGKCGDAMVYSYHDGNEVTHWIIINLDIFRYCWEKSVQLGIEKFLYEDKKEGQTGCMFRAFDILKINDKRLIIDSSFHIW